MKGTFLVALLFLPQHLYAEERDIHHTLTAIESDEWHELVPRPGSLLGRSFRVLANKRAIDWIQSGGSKVEGVEFLKLVLTVPSDINDQKWENARFESVRGNALGALERWSFFGFGPLRNPAAVATSRPVASCFACHSKAKWNGEPLFLSLYYNPSKVALPTSLRVLNSQSARSLKIGAENLQTLPNTALHTDAPQAARQ